MTSRLDIAPRFCQNCGSPLFNKLAIVGMFDTGFTCECPTCNFEFEKIMDMPDGGYPTCEKHGDYFYSASEGYTGCAICDLKASLDEISALKAIIETDKQMFDRLTKQLRADVVEMIRDEARSAFIDAMNTPIVRKPEVHEMAYCDICSSGVSHLTAHYIGNDIFCVDCCPDCNKKRVATEKPTTIKWGDQEFDTPKPVEAKPELRVSRDADS